MSEYQITFRLVGDDGNVDAVLAKTEKRVSSLGSASQQAGQNALRMGQGFSRGALQISSAAQRADAALHTISKTLVRVRADLGALFGYTLGFAALRGIRSLADGYTNLNSKIRTVSESEAELIRVRSRTFDIAQRTRTEYEATVSLYARLTRATANLATTEQERLRVTETINKAYIISGATVQEATNSIIQLTQSLAAGALRGEEFNSVAEQGPIILEILSRSLGKTRGELRAMSKEGLLTSEVVVKAILENSSIIDAQFAKMAVTIEGATTRVSNAWQKWIGEASAASDASAGIASFLTTVSRNMDTIAGSALVVAEALTLAFAGRSVGALLNYLATQRESVVLAAQQAAATREQALEQVALAQAQATAAAAKITEIEQRRANIIAIRKEMIAEVEQQAAKVRIAQTGVEIAALANAERRIQQSENGKLIYQQAIMTRMQEQMLLLTKAEIGARKELSAAIAGQTAAQTSLGVATNALGASQTAFAGGLSRIMAVGGTLFAAMGGWTTVVIGLAYALYSWGTDLVDNTQIIEAINGRIETLKQSSLELSDVWRGLVEGGDARKQTLLEAAQAQLRLQEAEAASIQSSIDFNNSAGMLTATLGTSSATAAAYGVKLLLANNAMDETRDAIKRLQDAEMEATLAGWANGALKVGQEWAVMLGFMEETQAMQDARDKKNAKIDGVLEKEVAKLKEKNFELTHTIRETMELQALEKLGVASLDELSAAQREQLNLTIRLTEENKRLHDAKKGNDKSAQRAAEREARELLKAAESAVTFRQETEALAAGLAGPLAEATNHYDVEFEKLLMHLDKYPGSAADVAERARLLKIEFDNNTSAITEQEKEIVNGLSINAKYEQSLLRMSLRQRAVAEAQRAATIYFKQNSATFARANVTLKEYVTKAGEAAGATYDMALQFNRVDEVLKKFAEKSPIQQAISDLKDMVAELARVSDSTSEAFDPARAEELTKAIRGTKAILVGEFAAAIGASLQSIQSATKEGSRSYAALGLAIQATTIAEGIAAVVHQLSQGDVYTAIPRAIAVAALVAQLVSGMKTFSASGFSDTAAKRQATQGTGTVLGDPEADSESIKNSVEITADATSKLVGINREMLRALLALEAALGSAANLLARGAGDADFSGLDLTSSNGFIDTSRMLHDSVGLFDFAGIFKGRSKITDEGIIIMGGAMSELLESIAVGAYQEVQSRTWAFGSTHTQEGIVPLGEEFSNQFQLVINSIADTVREGAIALGLLPADVEAAIAAFQVEEIRISLKDLTPEEAQAELAAVFSQLFDNLAGSVVPFIEQFQQVGEGLGETLVRVATGVQVTQEAVRYLGFALDEADPERFAQISEGLIGLVGGIEEMISGMQNFVSNFAPDAYQFAIASDAIVSALSQVGLTVPATADEMWLLMRSLDATTESGREQIAALLRLSEVSGQYYDQLDEQRELLEELGLAGNGLSAFGRELQEIRSSGEEAAVAANAIARAQGQQGASLLQLARIRQWTLDQEAAAIRRLQQATMDLIAQLYGGIPGSLEAIEAEIARLEGLGGSISGGFNNAINSTENFFEAWKSGMESLDDYLNSMLFGDLSALTPEEQLAEMWRQFNEAQQAALGGDTEALAALPQMADLLLQMIRDMDASGSDYNSQFYAIRDMLLAVQGTANPYSAPSNGGGGGGPATIGDLEALYAARDALLAEQENEYRAQLALQLAQNLSDLAIMLNTPILEMIELQGVSLAALAEDIGVNLAELNETSIQALGTLATTLGLSLTDLTNELGITLQDLTVGLTELTTRMGIDLSNLTVQSTLSLANLASSLGANLTELSTALAIDLGSLADEQSLMTQALQEEINSLAANQAEALQPYLDAITNATTEADANFAIQALNDAVNLLAPDIRNQLAPYLEDVFPVQALSELDNLTEIRQIASEQLDTLLNINRNLKSANDGAGLPSYAVGTGNVPSSGPAMLHKGEAVLPFSVASWLRENGIPAQSGGGSAEEMAALRAEVAALRMALEVNAEKTIIAIKETGKESDNSNNNAIERQTSQLAGSGRSSKY